MASRQDSAPSRFNEVWGVLLLAGCVLLSLSLFSYDWRDIPHLQSPPQIPPANFVGPTGAWVAYALFNLMGIGAYLLPLWCLWLGVYMLFFVQSRQQARSTTLWGLVGLWLITGWIEITGSWMSGLCRHLNIAPAAGGVPMRAMVRGLQAVFGIWGTMILLAALLLAALVALFGMRRLARSLHRLAILLQTLSSYSLTIPQRLFRHSRRNDPAAAMASQPRERPAPQRSPPRPPTPASRPPTPPPTPATVVPVKEKPIRPKTPATERPEAKDRPPELATAAAQTGYRLPGLDLLDPLPVGANRALENDTTTTARVIKETLAEFNIESEVTNVEQGPVVTRYELLPAAGVRVERIGGLSNNLALSLKATSVRVQAPIPGKGVVGIEVPNASASKVFLRQIVETTAWNNRRSELPIVLGQDVGGNDLLADLATMPHLLIAGATGSGKTVCMNTILAGLLMAKRPDELRLILVDPKIVEFSIYNLLPHLVVPVITDPKKVSIALRWAINEMERRYKLFAKAGVRNIAGYNSRPIERQAELFEALPAEGASRPEQPPDRVPYIAIIVDELADLMLTAQAEIENSIARLAQLSRAVGIHMIIATQRPSVNVITGTIKANFPARIAFQVAQKVDSRTILDANGADKLLGRGDMLFLPPGSSKLVRVQGAMTSDDEIHRIVEWSKQQAQPSYEPGIHEKIQNAPSNSSSDNSGSNGNGDEDNELMEASIQIIRETHRASTSSLQRRLRIGYTRAARIMDLLEERGVVGPPRGSDPREILIDLDGEIPGNASGPVTGDEP